MSAVAAAAEQPPDPVIHKSVDEREREIVIADLAGDGKTIQFTTSFTMTWKDPETGRVHTGTFSAKRPSLGQLGEIAVLKAKLNGGQKVDHNTDFLHEMISSMQIILTDFPDWWDPNGFFTVRPLREVWDHVRLWLENFHNKRMV